MYKEKTLNSKKNGVFGANLFVFAIMLLFMAYKFILIPFANKIPSSGIVRILVGLVLPQIVFLLIPTIVYLKITKKSFKKVLRLNKVGAKSLLITFGVLVLFYPVSIFANLFSMLIFPNVGVAIQNSVAGIPLVVKLCIVALMPAIFEEITMRGVALSGYDGISIGKSAVVIGFFFGTLHGNGNQFAYTFLMGIVLAYLVRITNSIIPSMLCHFVYNGFGTILAHNRPMGSNEANLSTMLNGKMLLFVLIIWFVIATVCVIGIIFLMKKLAKINNYSDEKQVEEFKRENNISGKIKIINWPFVGVIIMCIFSIGLQLVRLYVLK